jgi:aryl sulfotransferase
MSMSGSIVWLASYPSSGNTWLRIFLINLLRDAATPAGINTLVEVGHAASRSWIDACLGVASSDLRADEVADLRPLVYEAVAAEQPAPYFVKIHDACAPTPSGRPLIPATATRGVVYVIRNPLDVAVSFANHRATSVDAIIDVMADDDYALEPEGRGIFPMLPQRVGSWTTHVRGWVDESGLPLHVVRYEDMKRNPVATFDAIARFAGLSPSRETVRRAVGFSEFAELRRQEDEGGFVQGSLRAARFFRRGESGSWREDLSSEQVRRITATHGEVMKRFDYLAELDEGSRA